MSHSNGWEAAKLEADKAASSVQCLALPCPALPCLPTCLPACLPSWFCCCCCSGVVGILGSTYNGEFEDIKGLNDMLGEV
jgi:hypothetical protein